jgi:hypothetical protein
LIVDTLLEFVPAVYEPQPSILFFLPSISWAVYFAAIIMPRNERIRLNTEFSSVEYTPLIASPKVCRSVKNLFIVDVFCFFSFLLGIEVYAGYAPTQCSCCFGRIKKLIHGSHILRCEF